MLSEPGLSVFSPQKLDSLLPPLILPSPATSSSLLTNFGSGSGGFAENIFIASAKELFCQDISSPVNFKVVKNSDFQEVALEHEGEVKLKFCIVNGFRNIQNIVQRLKRKKCDYDFVEIMACPSGCLNGGAQSRPEDGVNPKDWISQLEEKYESMVKQWPRDNPAVSVLCDDWLGSLETDKALHTLLTDYKEVEKMTNSLAIKW